jgi:hypothetical protein
MLRDRSDRRTRSTFRHARGDPVGDNLEEVCITRRATNILGWPGSGAGDTRCGAWCGSSGDQVLEGYTVPPVIPEIVDIQEALRGLPAEVDEPNRRLVECPSIIFEL